MARDDEHFLSRWSRRKVDAKTDAQAVKAPPAAADAAPPVLPDPASLTFESDFKSFMQAKVEESVKRAALKKLFADPHFNVMDGLDVYIDDYSQDVVMPPGMAETLEHSKNALFGPRPEPEAPPAEAAEAGTHPVPDAVVQAVEAEDRAPQAPATAVEEGERAPRHESEGAAPTQTRGNDVAAG